MACQNELSVERTPATEIPSRSGEDSEAMMSTEAVARRDMSHRPLGRTPLPEQSSRQCIPACISYLYRHLCCIASSVCLLGLYAFL